MANKLNGFLCQWRSFMMFFDGRPLPGPFTKLLQALSRIGWSVQKPPFVIDHEGLVHNILVTPRPLLRARLEHAWLRFVALAHRHRDTMRDITGIEPTLLHRDADSLTPVNAARLASLRAGAFIFGPQQAKFDVTQTGFCAQCQVPDDAEHQVSHTAPVFRTSASSIFGCVPDGLCCRSALLTIFYLLRTRTCHCCALCCITCVMLRGFSSVQGMGRVGNTSLRTAPARIRMAWVWL